MQISSTKIRQVLHCSVAVTSAQTCLKNLKHHNLHTIQTCLIKNDRNVGWCNIAVHGRHKCHETISNRYRQNPAVPCVSSSVFHFQFSFLCVFPLGHNSSGSLAHSPSPARISLELVAVLLVCMPTEIETPRNKTGTSVTCFLPSSTGCSV